MNDQKPIIEFKQVSKSYGDVPVLSDVSLSVERGEFITLIGRSGCGKTTFLKLVNALLMPDCGTVRVFGEDVAEADLIGLRRRIGYVIQSVGLFPHMSVRKNVTYIPGLLKRGRRPETAVEPERLLEMVSLERSFLDRYPSELSGGQKQRVGIARALAILPSVLLMDEPFGAVDEITRKQLQDSIRDIHKKLGLTILFITHSIEEALMLGTRVGVFEDHRIVQCDRPEVLLEAPADEFVAELVKGIDRLGMSEQRGRREQIL